MIGRRKITFGPLPDAPENVWDPSAKFTGRPPVTVSAADLARLAPRPPRKGNRFVLRVTQLGVAAVPVMLSRSLWAVGASVLLGVVFALIRTGHRYSWGR